MLAEILTRSSHFEALKSLWEKLIMATRRFARGDCQGLTLTIFAKTLLQSDKKYIREAKKLLRQISKSQQRCEGYLLLARECMDLAREEILGLLDEIHEMTDSVGAIYQNKILPSMLECMLQIKEYEKAFERTKEVENLSDRISLQLDIVEGFLSKQEEEKAKIILDQVMLEIKNIAPQYGEQAKIYARIAKYQSHTNLEFSKITLRKALVSWDAVINPSYKKEFISSIANELLQIKNFQEMKNIWKKIYHLANTIEQQTYRFWAIYEVASASLQLGESNLYIQNSLHNYLYGSKIPNAKIFLRICFSKRNF